MADDTFDPAFWGKLFITTVAVFVLTAAVWLLAGYPVATALTAGLWLGPGLAVAFFGAASVYWIFRR